MEFNVQLRKALRQICLKGWEDGGGCQGKPEESGEDA